MREVDANDNRPDNGDPLVALARETIELYIRKRSTPKPPPLPADLPDKAGCFVSIHTHSDDALRGCIGTIAPTQRSLAEEIIQNAISAASRDPRFPPIDAQELNDLDISVDVLFEPEPATRNELDVKTYGVIVTQGFKRGLLLPDLEGVDSVTEQLRIACMKAGIDPNSSYDIERFKVVRHT